MADVTYIVEDRDVEEIIGFEKYKESDKKLINSFTLNNLFDPEKHFVELHIYGTANNLLDSDDNYTRYKFYGNAQSTGNSGASFLTIDPVLDTTTYGYERKRVKLLYHFLNDLFTPDRSRAEFFINAISPDRTELRLLATTLSDEMVSGSASFLAETIYFQSYFEGFRLNFGNNDLFICTNIQNRDFNNQKAVVVKLYEPLPSTYDIGSTLNIVEVISDSVSYEIDFTVPDEPVNQLLLKSPNFNLDIQDTNLTPSEYLNYNELFSFPVNNSNSEIYSVFNEKGIEISIDYNNYKDYIHFSSAQERLVNFKYKLDLITNYSTNLVQYQTSPGASGSVSYYTELIKGVLNNLDHYERYLYYESGSNSWPKNNNSRPYSNIISTSPSAQTWYSNKVNEAVYYDSINNNLLINTIPTYLRDDPNNEHYITFIHMIGQHFDNLWLYGKAVTDKYDADNRLDFGISRDLVAEALRNFGVQLYSSNKSIQDLFTTIIGQSYQSGSEQITNYITGSYTGSNASIQPSSYDNYQKEVYKRIYHNLPLLISSKGTERGLRALINCFGIPSDILQIKVYDGRNVEERPYYGDYRYYTSSLDKIRLDHTGSLITGSTLSPYTSIYKRDPKYTDDLHVIEVGFSPTDNVDNYIVSSSLATGSLSSFNIDDYIGDPRNLTSDSYTLLDSTGSIVDTLTNLTNRIMSSSAAYNIFDYVRLIKFFDNTIFKMVRDFIPARVTADTGIIIKPHLLQRNKAKSVILSGSRSEHSGSIDTAFIESSHGNTFGINDNYTTITYINQNNPITNYRLVQTPLGLGQDYRHGHEETKFDGDFSGSNITVTQGGLTSANIFTTEQFTELVYDIILVSGSSTICFLSATPPPLLITPLQSYQLSTFFGGTSLYTSYTASVAGGSTVYPVFPYIFTNTDFQQYQIIKLQATSSNLANCQVSTSAMYASCSIEIVNLPGAIVGEQSYDLSYFFSPVNNSNIKYFITRPIADLSPGLEEVTTTFVSFNPTDYPPGTTISIEARDITIETHTGLPSCRRKVTATVNDGCPITGYTNGETYFFNDTSFFETNTSPQVNPQTFKVCRKTIDPVSLLNTTPTIRSLFATGQNLQDTTFFVELVDKNDEATSYAFITPDSPLVQDLTAIIDPLNPRFRWSGDEIFTLTYYPYQTTNYGSAITWYGWNIQGGAFAAYTTATGLTNRWEYLFEQYLDVPLNQPTLGPDSIKLADCNIRISAYSTNQTYGGAGTCIQVVTIQSPVVDVVIDTCEPGVDYRCEEDEFGNIYTNYLTNNTACIADVCGSGTG